MFIAELLSQCGSHITALDIKSDTTKIAYNFWSDYLYERIMNIFVWKNTNMKPKEIEQRLLINGCCGVSMYKGELTVWYGSINGITKYYDEGTHFNTHSPVDSQILQIGKDCVVIDNNSVRNSVFPLIHRYALLLAHTDVSLIHTLINGREGGGTPIASTNKVKDSIVQYRNSLANGRFNPILDPAFLNAKFVDSHKTTVLNIKDLVEIRKDLLNEFYNSIGIRTTWNKKGNMISEEINGDNSKVLFNISDMLDSRLRGCEEVNKKFGTNWTVEKNKELEYAEGVNE